MSWWIKDKAGKEMHEKVTVNAKKTAHKMDQIQILALLKLRLFGFFYYFNPNPHCFIG
jgi:hypothetical protein